MDIEVRRETIIVDGRPVETLKELLKPGLKAVFIGLNPAPDSVAAGHYYQGRLGRRLWGRLQKFGIATDLPTGCEDSAAFEQGYGFADLVRRPTASAKELTRQEIVAGAQHLKARLEQKAGDHPLIIFTFDSPWRVAKDDLESSGYRVIKIPPFFMKSASADILMKELADGNLSIRRTNETTKKTSPTRALGAKVIYASKRKGMLECSCLRQASARMREPLHVVLMSTWNWLT